jgi:hypothetical protein
LTIVSNFDKLELHQAGRRGAPTPPAALRSIHPSQWRTDHDRHFPRAARRYPRRLDQIQSLAPDQVEAGLAWLARNDPPTFDATIQAGRTWDDGTPAEPEPYCVLCRGKVGLFTGQDGWRHYRDDGILGIQQYPATHRPVIGWRPADLIH